MNLNDPMIQIFVLAAGFFLVGLLAFLLGSRLGLRRELQRLEARLDGIEEQLAQPTAQSASSSAAPVGRAALKKEGKLVRKLAARLAQGNESSGKTEVKASKEAVLQAQPGPELSSGAEGADLKAFEDTRIDPESRLEILREALKNDRIDLALQPIVSLPQRQRRFYEGYARIRASSGAFLFPADFLALAEQQGQIKAIDNMVLLRTIQLVRRVQRGQRQESFFCNISTHTLHDIDFLADFVDYVSSNKELADQLVFEFAAGDLDQHSLEARVLLDRLKDYGCRFSVDGADPHSLDLDLMERRGIDFLKIDTMELLAFTAEGQVKIEALRKALKERHVQLIATHVEEERQAVQLVELAIAWGQGYLFGEPRPAREAA